MRFKTKCYPLNFRKGLNFFKFFFKNNAGRRYNNSNITILSKGRFKKTRCIISSLPTITKSFFLFFSFFISKKKMYILCKQATGVVFVLPYTYGVQLGQISIISVFPCRFFNLNGSGNIFFLKFAEKFMVFSNIYFKRVAKYATACGTYCQLLDKLVDYNLFWVTLPSKKNVLMSGWHFILSGRNSFIDRNTFLFGKAGSLKHRGLKPKVRGVARNPVDHPHGGRTKTNQPEKSIWGWVAKINK